VSGQYTGTKYKCGTDYMWVPLLEKAWAKVNGSYSNASKNTNTLECIRSIIGCPTKFMHHD
jgi:hypothetical protein